MILKILLPNHYRWWLALAAALVLVFLTANSGISFKSFEIEDSAGHARSTEMPFLIQGAGRSIYQLKGELVLDWFSPRTFELVPDDELQRLVVNGKAVDLSQYPKERLRDVNRGVTLDLGGLVQAGANQIEIQFEDYSGEMGMAVHRGTYDWRTVFLWLAWLTLVGCFVVAVLRRLGLSAAHSVLYILIAAGSLIHVWYVFTYNPTDHIFSDPERHWSQGIDVLRADLMALTDPIGYQLYIAFLGKFTLKIPALVAYCTSILAVLAPWLWYKFFRELQANKTAALAGWAILSLLPSWITIYAYFMQETLILPLLGAALWATWRCRRKGDVASFGLMIFLWVAAGLTRGITIPMAAVACGWLWLEQGLKFKKALCSSLILLVIMGPLTFRSYQTVHHFAPHGMGHLNVIYAQSGKKVIDIDVQRTGRWWFGSPSTGAKPFAPFSDWMTQRSGTVEVKVDLKNGMTDWKAAMDEVAMSWSDYGWILKENIIFLFFADSWPDTRAGRLVDDVSSVMRWLWAPLFLLAVVLFVVNARKFRRNFLLPAIIAAWFIVQALIPIAINEGRYRKPLEGLLVAQLILAIGMRRPVQRATLNTYKNNNSL
ncbi:MAG: hypothetical protein RL497_2960 [Pseudomonadota bacterium]|jgi:hypothetical protein